MALMAAGVLTAGGVYLLFSSRKKKSEHVKFVMGKFNYEAQHVPASLLSSGLVYVDRTTTGADEAPVGEVQRTVSVPVRNARGLDLSIDSNGVKLVPHVIQVCVRLHLYCDQWAACALI